MTVKLAFVGTGFNKIHAAAAKKTDTELVAVVNHKSESMAKFASDFNIPRQYEHLSDLIRDGGVDTLIVSTPNYLHSEQTIAGLEAGLHVLVEKPMAANSIQAEAMNQSAQKTGRLLMVGHCFRFDPETIWLRSQIVSGKIGSIVQTKGSSIHVNWGPTGWFSQK